MLQPEEFASLYAAIMIAENVLWCLSLAPIVMFCLDLIDYITVRHSFLDELLVNHPLLGQGQPSFKHLAPWLLWFSPAAVGLIGVFYFTDWIHFYTR